jgi:hypothetical protein
VSETNFCFHDDNDVGNLMNHICTEVDFGEDFKDSQKEFFLNFTIAIRNSFLNLLHFFCGKILKLI